MTQGPDPTRRTALLRLGLPPAVSVVVHALLLGLIVIIGVSAERAVAPRPRLAEVEIAHTTAAPIPSPTQSLAAPLPTARPTVAPVRAPSIQSLPIAADTFDPNTTFALPESSLGTQAAALTEPGSTRTTAASFAGLKAHAAGRIVYVVDASGAVVPTLTYIKRRLAQSIDRLAPTQRFEIIFFREPAQGADSVEPRPRFVGGGGGGLTRATPQARADAAAWIDTIHAAGRSDPAAALAEAIALKPDLIFLLSTSIQRTETDTGSARTQLLTQLNALNPVNRRTGQRPVVIKALQFLRPDPANLLRDIALLHGDGKGSYRLLTANHLDSPNTPNTPDLSQSQPEAGDTPEPHTAQAALQLAQLEPLAWTVLLGLPTTAERAEVRRAAEQTLSRLARTPEPQRDTRWDLLHLRATLFYAVADSRGLDTQTLQRAADNPVRAVLVSPGPDLERRLINTLTRVLGNTEPDSQADTLAQLATEAAQDGYPGVALRATLAALVNGSPLDSSTLDPNAPRDRLLVAEAHARAALATDTSDPAAFDPLLALLDDERVHPFEPSRRRLVWDRLAAAGEMFEIDWDSAKGPAALGRAAVLAQSEHTQPQGLAALEHVADRNDLKDATRAEALWHAAIAERTLAQTDPDAQARVSLRLRQLVEQFSGSPHARDAAAAALALGAEDTGELADVTPAEFVTLALTLFADHPAADRWQLGLAHRAAGLQRLTILEEIEPGSHETLNAAALYLQTIEPARSSGLVTTLERALRYAHARGIPEWYTLALQTALASESTQPARSAELYLALAQADHEALGLSQDSLTLSAGRSLLAAGQLAQGVAVLTDLAARLEAASNRDEIFWHSWAMVLETLADSDHTDTRAQGRAHAARLRLLDPGFGGGSIGARATNAANRLDSAHEHDPAHGSAHPD